MRNAVQPGHANVSRLGACLRFRTLLEDEVIRETLERHAFGVAEKWLQEVCWRRYWKGWLETRPAVWTRWREQVRALRLELPAARQARAEAVAAGASGVACMDAMARELMETGYLHNHARMWWASFWIHVERLPWELGADFFFRHLLDADPASNTLSWRWVAGLHTPGKSYLVRLSNIEKYAPHYLAADSTGSQRLADGSVFATVPDEHGAVVVRPLGQMPTSFTPSGGRYGIWLHPDDLVPEIGPLAGLSPAGIAACFSERVYRDAFQLSGRRVAALKTVLRDGLDRAAVHFGCAALKLEAADPADALCSWAVEHRLAEVVALAPMAGPVHDMLGALRRRLEAAGIRLTLIRRPSDAAAFSFVTAGFFPFWQKMRRELNQV
jgi:deoxyribodipyrimidine photo-lyase